MSKGENKRQTIFDKYKNSLNLLIDNGLANTERDIYICPICLTPHTDINSNDPLTLEDAPPKSLGGTANTLTCKSCNNIAGHKIDFHLTERLREIDDASFLPGSEMVIKVKINDEVFQGKISVDLNGKMTLFHSKKNNNPDKLDKTMQQVKEGTVVDINFLKSRVIPENLEFALLKTGYIMAFERFGYSLILNDCFNLVREQLKKPEQRVYPEGFWHCPPYPKTMSGVYFIDNNGIESLIAMFNLDTGKTERMFTVLLPLPIQSIDKVIKRFNLKLKKESEMLLTLYPLEQQKINYLNDIPNVHEMYDWLRKKSKYYR